MRNDYNQFIKDTMKTIRDENPGLTGREVLRTARDMCWAQLKNCSVVQETDILV